MEDYFERIEKKTEKAYDVAEKARDQGKDPENKVDIPVAEDLAAKSEGLISASMYPELENSGVKDRIRDLEEEYGKNDERVALVIGKEIAQNEFYNFEDQVDAIDAGLRVGLAYMTGGIVTAPLEGIADTKIRENPDGSDYLAVYYSGPIRSAGGTASALSVLLADYIRQQVGLDRYKPSDEEVDRYAVEVEDYFTRVTKKQYTPERKETSKIAENVPIEITGTPTETLEVSNHKDLERIDTNRIRGGMALIYLDGLPLKASKIKKRIKSYGEEFNLMNWKWVWDYLELQHEIHSKDSDGDEEDSRDEGESEEEEKSYEPSGKFLGNIVAGRPVFSHHGKKGGFRLRYGRSRTAGLAACSFHPATLEVCEKFPAIGTQLKIEYPGKATVVTVCDSIDGPIVKLDDGSIVRLDTREDVEEVEDEIEEIVFVGDILVPFGEFLENGKRLLPSPWVEEWWAQEVKEEISEERYEELEEFLEEPYEKPDFDTAMEIAEETGTALHPEYVYLWDRVPWKELKRLYNSVISTDFEEGKPFKINIEASDALEEIFMPFEVSGEEVVIDSEKAKLLNEIFDEDSSLEEFKEDTFSAVENSLGVEIRDVAPIFLGSRMGRPEKAERRALKGDPRMLFPCGKEEGGRMRNIMRSYNEYGQVKEEIIQNFCEGCQRKTYFGYCPYCGEESSKKRICTSCGQMCEEEACPSCNSSTSRKAQTEIPVKELMNIAKRNLDMRRFPELLKSPRAVTGRYRHVEPIEKGLLRKKYDLYVNKDGTTRYDSTDLPLTHFKPKEIGTSVEDLRRLGYTEDIEGKDLEAEDQVLKLKPQDIILSRNRMNYSGAEYLYNAARFVDEMLENFYDLDSFYDIDEPQDIVGELIIGLAPHTSGGIVGRIIGFTDAKGTYAHPYWHAGKRRNCMPGDTEVVTDRGLKSLEELFKKGVKGEVIDSFGTEKVEVDVTVNSYDRESKEKELKPISAVYRTKAQDHIVKVRTDSGRRIEMFPDHRVWTVGGVKRARELDEGDSLYAQKEIDNNSLERDSKIDLFNLIDSSDVMVRDCSEHVNKVIEDLGGLKEAANRIGLSMKSLGNYKYRESIPIETLKRLEDHSGIEPTKDMNIAAKRDTVEIPRMVDKEALCRLLGFYAAEGYSRMSDNNKGFYQVNIAYGDRKLENNIEEAIIEAFDIVPNDADHEKVISSRLVYELFENIGAGDSAHTKQVPEMVMEGTKEDVVSFLRSYFAGDGGVEKGSLHVSCQSVSRRLIEDIGLLLQKFGVFYRIRSSSRKAGGILLDKYGEQHYEGREFTSYKLQIRSENAVRFGKEIGFNMERKQQALEEDYGLVRSSREEDVGDLVKDEITDIEIRATEDEYMYDLEVEDNHNFATGAGIVSNNCDGDEDSVILLMDALLNFSRQFLPDRRGTRTMDAPLILSTVLKPDEVDDESWNVDVQGSYSTEFYHQTQEFIDPGEADVKVAEDAIEEGEPFRSSYTHDTSSIENGPIQSNYVTLGEMSDKVKTQLGLGRKIKAVEEDDVAELLLKKHFMSDIIGNLRAFSRQELRCVDCNKKYRRAPLHGDCGACGGDLLLTVSEGTIRKYLIPSEEIAENFDISTYRKQHLDIVKKSIQSLFGKAARQSGLGQFTKG